MLNGFKVDMQQSGDYLSQLAEVNLVDGEKGHDDLIWSHSQLRHAASKAAIALLAHGVQPGSTVVTLISNRVEWAIMLYAVNLCGMTLASLDFGALSSSRSTELQNFMSTLKPAVVIVANVDDTKSVDDALSKAGCSPQLKMTLDADLRDTDPQDWKSLSKACEISSPDAPSEQKLLEKARQSDPDRLMLICFTSGTSSGRPKGCPRSVKNTTFVMQSQESLNNFDSSTRYLGASANFRIVPPALALQTWRKGGAYVIPGPAFSPPSVLEAFEKHGITNLTFLPAQLHALASAPSFTTQKVRTLKQALFGGDMITRSLLKKARATFPSARIAAAHGMTEGGGLFSWPFYESDVESIPYFGDISPLGISAPGSRLRMYDNDKGQAVKRNELGEVQVHSPGTIKHYLDGVNEEYFFEDEAGRWFKIGDLGLINENGVIYILGRLNDRIKRGGIPITPVALESSIDQYTASQVWSRFS